MLISNFGRAWGDWFRENHLLINGFHTSVDSVENSGQLAFFRLEVERVVPWFGQSQTWHSSFIGRAIAGRQEVQGSTPCWLVVVIFLLCIRQSISSFSFKIFILRSPRVLYALLSTSPETTVLLLAFCSALLLLSTLTHRRWLGACLDFSTHKCQDISG